MAIDSSLSGRSPECTRPGCNVSHTTVNHAFLRSLTHVLQVRRNYAQQMGYQQRFYGLLRLRRCPDYLGPLGLQNGFWHIHVTLRRTTWPSCHYGARTRTIAASIHIPGFIPELPSLNHGLFPVCLRSYHNCHYGRSLPRPHEFHRLDDFRPLVDHILVHGWSLLPLGRWLALPNGCNRLFRWLRHSLVVRNRRFRWRALDWTSLGR